MDIQAQRVYYNKVWGNVGFANNLKLARCIAILDSLYSYDVREPKICDLGSGTGWLTNILNTFGPTTGVELSDVAVEQASQRYPSCEFICADISTWQGRNNSFDVVVSQEVIEHFEHPERYLSVAHRVLRPGGYLILTTPNATTALARRAEERSNQPIENWVTSRQLQHLLERDFISVHTETFIPNYGSSGVHKVFASNKILRLLGALGLKRHWERLACTAGLGLHILARARKGA